MRLSVAIAVSALLATSLSAAEIAAAAVRHTTNIPAQELGSALATFAKERNLQLVYLSDAVDTLHTTGAVGEFTADEALTKLLSGTGLSFKYLDDHTVTVVPVATRDSRSERTSSSASREGRVEGARATDAKSGTGEEGLSSRLRVAQAAATESSGHSTADSRLEEYQPQAGKGIPEVLVKGAKSINADIERTEDDPQPYVVFDAEQIARSQATTVGDFLKTRLPMNTVQTANGQAKSNNGGISEINLRGLGSNQTLILVDGRRMPSFYSSSGSDFAQPDINGVPIGMIERIEVLPATASGIYGGGATGGVVNIVTRKDYVGLDVSANYGNAFSGDVSEHGFDANAGFSLEGGRTHVTLSGRYSTSGVLFNSERDFTRRGLARQLATNPSAMTIGQTRGYTTNICAAISATSTTCSTAPLVLDSGASLGSSFTSVPVGYAGPASDGGAALRTNAGQYNLDLSDDGAGALVGLMGAPTIRAAIANVRRSFGDSVEAFTDFSYLDDQSRNYYIAALSSLATLAGNSPGNPFTNPIVVSFPTPGLTARADATSQTMRAAGGVLVRLPHEWTAGADYVWARSRSTFRSTAFGVGDPDGSGPGLSLTQAAANGTLDVLRDVNAYPLDLAPYLLPSPNSYAGPYDSRLGDANVRLSGPLFHLPGGPLTLSTLVEYRREDAEDSFQDNGNASGVSSTAFVPSRWQHVTSYYLETRAPLFSAANALPFVRALEWQASVRRDEYKTMQPRLNTTSPSTTASLPSRDSPLPGRTEFTNDVEATKFTLGTLYKPLEDLTVRASYGTGFLPPSITQLVSRSAPSSLSVADPKRGGVNTSASRTQISGGNADLSPEESKSWSVGAIVAPQFLSGFRLSIDYTRIEKTNEIRQLQQQDILNLEDQLPGRVTRGPLEANAPAGYTAGPIQTIDISLLNVSRSQVSAYDVQADYLWKSESLGDFHFYSVATWEPHLERKTVPTSVFVDSAGFTGGVLKWRGNAGLTWEKGAWNAGWSAQYYDSYWTYSAVALPLSAPDLTTRNNAILNQGSDRIPSQMYHDVFVGYRFDRSTAGASSLFSGTEITLGVQNVLDKSPPILAITNSIAAGYSTYGDPRLRRFSLVIRKHFSGK